jgi:hypothetical protein
MIDEQLARLRTHRDSIGRYRRLLQTKLTDLERQFIEDACPKNSRLTSACRKLPSRSYSNFRHLQNRQQLTRLLKVVRNALQWTAFTRAIRRDRRIGWRPYARPRPGVLGDALFAL